MAMQPTRLWPKGQQWNEYDQKVDVGWTLEDIMGRDYWLHVARGLRPLDIINCVAIDGSFDVAIRVISISPTEIKFRLLRETRIERAAEIPAFVGDRFEVKQQGRNGGFAVREKRTGKLIYEGASKDDAELARANAENQAA